MSNSSCQFSLTTRTARSRCAPTSIPTTPSCSTSAVPWMRRAIIRQLPPMARVRTSRSMASGMPASSGLSPRATMCSSRTHTTRISRRKPSRLPRSCPKAACIPRSSITSSCLAITHSPTEPRANLHSFFPRRTATRPLPTPMLVQYRFTMPITKM